MCVPSGDPRARGTQALFGGNDTASRVSGQTVVSRTAPRPCIGVQRGPGSAHRCWVPSLLEPTEAGLDSSLKDEVCAATAKKETRLEACFDALLPACDLRRFLWAWLQLLHKQEAVCYEALRPLFDANIPEVQYVLFQPHCNQGHGGSVPVVFR